MAIIFINNFIEIAWNLEIKSTMIEIWIKYLFANILASLILIGHTWEESKW